MTALKVDSLGNKFEQLNQIDHGDSEDLDEFDIPKSKKSKYRKRGSIGSKRTVVLHLRVNRG